MFIDTHCHLSSDDYDDIDLVVKESYEAGVGYLIISGCSYEWINEAIDISKKYNNIYVSLGYHPSEADVINDEKLQYLVESLNYDKVVALGEIGLDYYYGKDNKEKQLELFEKQLKIAEDRNMRVVIHSRDATEDTINCLKRYKVKGVVHCFSGSVETAKQYISMGYKIGIGGVLTFKNSKLFEVVKAVGIENILLETDAPYLTPVPFRGKQNSSKYIPYIADEVARILNISIDAASILR
jgi:TatD DNase family protein